MLRLAKQKDAEEILGIYEYYIQQTAITFEYDIPTQEAFSHRIQDIQKQYPYLIYEQDQEILGYAYAHPFQERAAFQFHAELSVYVKRGCTARGIGKALYQALMEILTLQGVQKVYGLVCIPNEKSQRLHENCGFQQVARFPQVGYKLGCWHDLGYYEKKLEGWRENPCAIDSIHQIEPDKIKKILQKYEVR